jgi:broad specificity phosphatase PhoE
VTRLPGPECQAPSHCTEIFLVRHGQSVHNKQEIIAGQLDSELAEQGFVDARSVAEAIGPQHFEIVYCSDLRRARQTAEVIVEALRLACPLSFSPFLRELDYGQYTNRPVSEAFHFLNYKIAQDQRYPGGESFQDLKKRVALFLDQLRIEAKGKRVLIVAHAGSIRMLLMLLDEAHAQEYLGQTFGNRYVGRIVLGSGGEPVSYEVIQDGRSESV